jgi:actin-like ATPase involved in cell morphogenesis
MPVAGFDFGTTNSLMSIVRGDRAISSVDDAGLPTPSVVCYEGSRTIVGREARERLADAGLGIKGNIVPSPKTLLGRESVDVEGVSRSPVEITAEVVRHVIEVARAGALRNDIDSVSSAVVTIPVNMQGFRRAALRDAFRRADIRIQQFVHEPFAALYGHLRGASATDDLIRHYDRQLLLVVDWGGGTLDITLCRPIDGVLYQIANDGTDQVGGDVFDDVIRASVLDRVLVSRGLEAHTAIRPDAIVRLRHQCEIAKIALSGRRQATIYVPSFFRGTEDESLDYQIQQEELSALVRPVLEKGIARIAALLGGLGVSPAQVSLCLAVGGMANMPEIRSRLHEWFGVRRVQVSPKSASLIAEGAAWIAHDGVCLELAKNVEVLLARNSTLTAIRAGTKMPLGGQSQKADPLHLFCTDPRDGTAKFQLQCPEVPGSARPGDTRRILCVLTTPVDSKAKPFQERLELSLSIDENLILKAKASSLNVNGSDQAEVHDLEFSLRLPAVVTPRAAKNEDELKVGEHKHSSGSLTVRANVADREDDRLVPGELLHSYNPRALDPEWKPPASQEQQEEFLYYELCSFCKRPSNDPSCRCISGG